MRLVRACVRTEWSGKEELQGGPARQHVEERGGGRAADVRGRAVWHEQGRSRWGGGSDRWAGPKRILSFFIYSKDFEIELT
jgi:hypothetical protein